MGGILSLVWGTAEDPKIDVPDKATGITPRERGEVTRTWAMVKQDLKGNGETLLINFFRKHPDDLKRFAAFGHVPLDELKGNKKLQAHANSVMYAVSAIVDNLTDPECLIEMLLKYGRNHAKINVPEQAFKNLKTVLLDLLQEKLGPIMTPACFQAWDKTLDVAYSVIFKGMAEIHSAQKQEAE